MTRRWARRLLVLAVAGVPLVWSGCAGSMRAVRGYPPPSAAELLDSLKARQARLGSMNAETRATSWLGGERVRGTVQMLVARSGQLRFEAEVALQGTVAVLAVNAGQFAFVDYQKHVFREGPACPANVAALIRIPLAPAAVAAILLGDAPLAADSRPSAVAWDAERGADVLVLDDGSGARLWIGMRRAAPAVPAWDVVFLEGAVSGSAGRWRVAYEDLARLDGVALPRLIRFAEPGKGFDDGVEIRMRERTIDPSFPPGAFVLERPPGYKVELASCPARGP